MNLLARLDRVLALLRDPRTPKLPKLAVGLAVLYLLWPADLLPAALLPVVGWIDDLVALWASLSWLLRSARPTPPASREPAASREPPAAHEPPAEPPPT